MTPRRRKKHKPEQIVAKLRDADAMLNAGKDLAAVLQALESARRRLPAGGDEKDRHACPPNAARGARLAGTLALQRDTSAALGGLPAP